MEKQEKNLLAIIKITPPLIILLASLLIINLMNNQQEHEIQEEHDTIEKQFIQDEKERIKANVFMIYNLIKDEDKSIESELKNQLESNVNDIYKIMDSIYKANINKKSKDEIIKEIKIVLRNLRFNDGRLYPGLMNTKGISVLHVAKPEIEGTYILNIKDLRDEYPGRKIFNILNTSEKEGFVEYYIHKIDDIKKEYKRITKVKLFKELDLLIILGDYVENFKVDVQNKILKQLSKLKYEEDEYIYVINFKGDVIYHPSKKVSGNIFKDDKFSHVSKPYSYLISEEGKDVATYINIDPKLTEGKDTKETNITYLKRFDEWKWIISTNFKLSEAKNIIEIRKNILEKKYDSYRSNILFYGIIFTFFMLTLSFFVSRLLEKKFLKYKKNLENQIKENKTQNKKLILLKTNLDNAIKMVNLGIWEWDVNKNTITWSDIMYDIYNVDKNISLNLEFIESLVLKEDLSLHREKVNKCLENKKALTFEYRIRKNNNIRMLLVICNPIIENDKVVKLTGIVQDITELKENETLLRISNKRFEQTEKIAKIGSWEQLSNNGKLYWSKEAYSIFELDNQIDLNFEKFIDIVHPDDREKMFLTFQTSVKEQKEYYLEHRLLFSDGRIKYVIERAVHDYDKKNNHLCTLGTVQDITSLKKMEIENKEKEQILFHQSKMAAMGEMLGNIGHQWRQPLSIISTTATGAKLQNELGVLNINNMNSYFDTINDTAQYLSQTIDDFKGFFNPQNSKVKEFKISDAIDKSLKLVSAQFIAKDIEIIENIEDFEIEAVENELVQVLINILNNAKDALLKVENQKRYIFINTYKNDSNLIIEIKDNANGIPKDIIDRVFEPYFTTKHQSQGTGIGLYMSEEIIKNHVNGKLSVSNDTYFYQGIEYIGAKFCIQINY